MTTQRGFTLIEMAVVLIIVTILIGGLAMPLSAQIQARRIAETKKTLEEAREAIIGYAMSHPIPSSCTSVYMADTTLDVETETTTETSTCPVSLCPATSAAPLTLPITRHFLPCPDLTQSDPEPNRDNDGDGVLSDLNNGREDRYTVGPNAGACAATSGHLPWVTLGTGAHDAWGNRLRYAVTTDFASKGAGFSPTDSGNLQICSASGCATVNVASDVPAVLISYGPNGWGARNINANTLAAPTSQDELENTNGDINFVSRSPSKAGEDSGEFDDLLVWVSDSLIRSRVCPSGGCP